MALLAGQTGTHLEMCFLKARKLLKCRSKEMEIRWSIPLAICGLFVVVESAFTQTWTQTSAPSNSWVSIAASADGSKLAAVSEGGPIFISTNSGTTWMQTSAPTNNGWDAIASSADGSKLVVVSYNGPIGLSTNSGTTWTLANAPNPGWGSVASSADGIKLAAVAPFGGYNYSAVIYTSTDSGTTWIQQTNADTSFPAFFSCVSIASSADGTRLVVVGGLRIYYSTNSGANWAETGTRLGPSSLASPTQVIASSADSKKWVVALSAIFSGTSSGPAPIYTTTNSGDTWTLTSAPSNTWLYVATSADGSKIAAVAEGSSITDASSIYTSTDFGATWMSNNLPAQVYRCVTFSADGGQLLAGSFGDAGMPNGGGIYILQTTQAPKLNLTSSGSNLTASWVVPSTNFVLQQSSDLTLWADLTNAPTLNLTNLQDEVVLSPTNSSGFYRLKTP